MSEAERVSMLRYTRPERWPLLDRFPVGADLHERILAEVLADDTAEVRRRVAGLGDRADVVAGELVSGADYLGSMRRLPFRGGDRLAALGDSLTADRVGWFELLTRTMRLTGHEGVATHNLGLSGSTTADAIERFDLLEAFRPTHVLVLLGTNDARRHGRANSHRMVSAAETARNLRALADLIGTTLGAHARFITPPPADQRRITAHFTGSAIGWSAAELDEVAQLVRSLSPDHVDLHHALAGHGVDAFLDADGVHLSARGQRLVAASVAHALALP